MGDGGARLAADGMGSLPPGQAIAVDFAGQDCPVPPDMKPTRSSLNP